MPHLSRPIFGSYVLVATFRRGTIIQEWSWGESGVAQSRGSMLNFHIMKSCKLSTQNSLQSLFFLLLGLINSKSTSRFNYCMGFLVHILYCTTKQSRLFIHYIFWRMDGRIFFLEIKQLEHPCIHKSKAGFQFWLRLRLICVFLLELKAFIGLVPYESEIMEKH